VSEPHPARKVRNTRKRQNLATDLSGPSVTGSHHCRSRCSCLLSTESTVSQDLSTHRFQAQKVRAALRQKWPRAFRHICQLRQCCERRKRLPQRFHRDSTIPPAQMKQHAFIRKNALPVREKEKVFSSRSRTRRHFARLNSRTRVQPNSAAKCCTDPAELPTTALCGARRRARSPHTPVRCSNQARVGALGRPPRML